MKIAHCVFLVLIQAAFVFDDTPAAQRSSIPSLLLLDDIEAPPNAPTHLWNDVKSMSVNESGNLLVMFNTKPPRVSVLETSSLNLVGSFGKTGKGPGEFESVWTWVGIRHDTVIVSQKVTTSFFLVNGTHLGNDIKTVNRSIPAIMNIARTMGVDGQRSVYFWDARPQSDFLISKRLQSGLEVGLVKKGEMPFAVDGKKGSFDLGVLADGSIILSFYEQPLIVRYNSQGERVWSIDLSRNIPYIRKNYEDVKEGKLMNPNTCFWSDETYTVLTFHNRQGKAGQPNIYWVFVDSRTGRLVELSHVQQNVISSEHQDYLMYIPWAIAHSNGMMFSFSYNSGRLQKYKLMWHK